MMSLMSGLPLSWQVLGDIEIAQTMKKDQEEASQKLEVILKSWLLAVTMDTIIVCQFLWSAGGSAPPTGHQLSTVANQHEAYRTKRENV